MPAYAALEDQLRGAGFEPTDRQAFEKRDAGTITLVAIYLADKISDDAISRLVGAVGAWAWEHIRPVLQGRGKTSTTIPIYGPDGEVIREVRVPVEDDASPPE